MLAEQQSLCQLRPADFFPQNPCYSGFPAPAGQKEIRVTPQEATQQGLQAHQAGRLNEAEAHYAAALKVQPDFVPALHLTGLLRFEQQNFAGAAEAFSRAITASPHGQRTPLYAGRGEALLQMERHQDALEDFDKALADDAGMAAAWNNRGLALGGLGRHDDAVASFERAATLSPNAAEIHNNRGDVLRELRRFDEALASFARALQLAPEDWRTFNNRAVALSLMGRAEAAIADYDQALTIQPDVPQALHARGNLLWTERADLAGALADLERLVKIAPDYPFARGSLMRLKMHAARWEDFETQRALLEEGVRADRPVIEPFIHLALSDRPEELARAAKLYADMRFAAKAPLWQGAARRPGRIRIGYVCGEFRAHATLYLMAGLFEAHDKNDFEIFAFDNGGSDQSVLRARFEAAVEHSVDIRQMSDAAAAAHIRALDIDILVDLNGYCGSQRLGIFAHRPSAVQVSYLAYPGTLGAPYMDYLLADRIVIGDETQYCEKIVLLPHSYQINDDRRATAPPLSRAQAGLPAESCVFCNFNHVSKFTPESFSRWMRILDQVAGSVFWLLEPHAIARENLRAEARKRGIDPERLIFAPHLPFEKHLARLGLGDLFLDGLPYGAHTTASDALWAGLPLLTCKGKSFAGRVAASVLSAAGLPEMIVETPEAFEARALALARDAEALSEIRAKLAQSRATAPLFDTKRTTRAIEAAYRKMMEYRGQPQGFPVADR